MRLSAPSTWLGLLALLAAVPGTLAQSTAAPTVDSDGLLGDPHEGRFVYLRSGAPIALQASPVYAAALVPPMMGRAGPLTPPDGLELDLRGNRPDLIERGLTLFRVPHSVVPRGLDTAPPDAWQVTLRSGLPAQPVFEHGAALRIPSDEVIVAFDPATTLEEAKRLLSEAWDKLDALRLLEFRSGIFVCVLREASAGRSFEVSQILASVKGVRWAEPSFINVHLETPGGPPAGRALPDRSSSLTHHQTLESKFLARLVSTVERDPESKVWQLALDAHFEDDIAKWTVARDEGSNRILPVVVRERTHDGKRAVYMSGKGLAGNVPTDSYLEGASSYLVGPVFDLKAYTEVFVEVWFWARLEDPMDAPRRVYDLGRVLLHDVESKEYLHEYPIAPVGPTGDLTRGPGTERGWRKLMFRVPVELLTRPLQVFVHFYSDGVGEADGLFVDDVRVLYGTGDGGDPFSRDPAAQRQYEIMPRGQIAGRPAPSDPASHAAAAWSAGIPRKKVIVALLDDGVERDHPDLAFWEPATDERTDGDPREKVELPPGEPVVPEDRHGTACAGVLGAVANNGIGIAGVAPGTLLLPLHRGIDDLSIARAIDDAAGHDADVLVIPWGWSGAAPELITRVILDAIDAGTTVVAAAGDGVHRPYSDAVDYPCVLSGSTALVCVGASSPAGELKGPASADGLYWWSSAADESGPDLLAPGTWLHATDRAGPFGYNDGSQGVPADLTNEFSGTGAAACYAGGVAALMASHDPLLSPEEVKRLITASATRLPSSAVGRADLRLVAPEAAARAAIESAAARDREGAPPEAIPGR